LRGVIGARSRTSEQMIIRASRGLSATDNWKWRN